MPGGKVHGQGGHGRHSREMQRTYAHGEIANEKIVRRKAKAERKQERNVAQLMEKLSSDIIPKVNALYARLRQELQRGVGSKRTLKIKILAINEWYIDEIEKQMIKKRLTHEPLNTSEREQISLVERKDYLKYMGDLVGKNPTQRSVVELREQMSKWKNRVPKMLLGQY